MAGWFLRIKVKVEYWSLRFMGFCFIDYLSVGRVVMLRVNRIFCRVCIL